MTLREEVTHLLQELVRLDTVNPPGNETRAAEALRGYLARHGVASALVAELRGGGFREENSFSDPTVLALTRLIALPIAVSLWLTFLAPARYQTWLRSRAARRAA